MITKENNKIQFKNNDQLVFELPDNEVINDFLDSWYFLQKFSKKEKDVSIFEVKYLPLQGS